MINFKILNAQIYRIFYFRRLSIAYINQLIRWSIQQWFAENAYLCLSPFTPDFKNYKFRTCDSDIRMYNIVYCSAPIMLNNFNNNKNNDKKINNCI